MFERSTSIAPSVVQVRACRTLASEVQSWAVLFASIDVMTDDLGGAGPIALGETRNLNRRSGICLRNDRLQSTVKLAAPSFVSCGGSLAIASFEINQTCRP